MNGQKPLEITLVTGNKRKLEELRTILPTTIKIQHLEYDLPEIQGENEEIAKEKCRLAAKHINGAVITEDTSLGFNALGGLPGPYVKWFYKKIGLDGLSKLLEGFEDKTAEAQCILSYCSGPNEEPVLFVGKTSGTIVKSRGQTTFGWDSIFVPEHQTKTYAELDKSVKNTLSHRYKAVEKLKQYFESQ